MTTEPRPDRAALASAIAPAASSAAVQDFNRFLRTPPTEREVLEPTGTWPLSHHFWTEREFRALAAAGFSGRPLLVKGEPGVGKSQLAHAAATRLRWRFESEVITPRFEPEHLLWRFDAVRRLAMANQAKETTERDYITPGALWRALDPVSARVDPRKAAKRGCVLLIDEIDKADSDLPNSLLEVLANRSFNTRFDGVEEVHPAPAGSGRPAKGLLVVLTSNDERELPLAFLRRCVVLELAVPDEEKHPEAFIAWLLERGEVQHPEMHFEVRHQAAEQVRRDRAASPRGLGARPGLAEYQDLLRALSEIVLGASDEAAARKQLHWLDKLSPYFLRKQPGQDQSPSHAAPSSLEADGVDADDTERPDA
jgi:MoxR-like ATPase